MKLTRFLALVAALPAICAAQNLILNNLHGETIAYEIPDAAGRAEAVHYIEAMRDRFYPGVEIVDAGALDEAALRIKLKGTLVLYTTLSPESKLLRLVAQPLPLRVEQGTFHWGDLHAPAKDLRVVFVGKHPYAEGYSVVYAAGSNALLAQANNMYHGPCSYHIYRGDGRGELLREGFYNQTFVEKPDRLSSADALADAREFFSTLEHSHPNLFAKVSKASYEEMKKQTLADLAAHTDKDGKIPVADLAWSLYYAGAYFKDGHTGLYWRGPPLTDSNTSGKRFPPFWLDSENGRYFIANAQDKSLAGAELLEVNATPIDGFFRPILEHISGETRTYRAANLAGRQPFWYAMSNVFGAASYTLKIRDSGGAVREQSVTTLPYADFRQLAPKGRGPQTTHVEFLDDGKIARLVIPSLVYGADRKQTDAIFDRAFDEIRKRQSADIILDIRGNGGGDSRMGDYVLALARHFKGKLYMLTDHIVFSSALMFADAFHSSRAGTIIGYETGGTPSHYGYPRSFSLEKSGISYGVSRTHFNARKPEPGDDSHGVIPDVPVTHDLLVPYNGDPDPVLAFALAYIRKAGGVGL